MIGLNSRRKVKLQFAHIDRFVEQDYFPLLSPLSPPPRLEKIINDPKEQTHFPRVERHVAKTAIYLFFSFSFLTYFKELTEDKEIKGAESFPRACEFYFQFPRMPILFFVSFFFFLPSLVTFVGAIDPPPSLSPFSHFLPSPPLSQLDQAFVSRGGPRTVLPYPRRISIFFIPSLLLFPPFPSLLPPPPLSSSTRDIG